MKLNEDQVLEQLKKVIDPELFVNIVDLGLIYKVDINETDGEDIEPGTVAGAWRYTE